VTGTAGFATATGVAATGFGASELVEADVEEEDFFTGATATGFETATGCLWLSEDDESWEEDVVDFDGGFAVACGGSTFTATFAATLACSSDDEESEDKD